MLHLARITVLSQILQFAIDCGFRVRRMSPLGNAPDVTYDQPLAQLLSVLILKPAGAAGVDWLVH